MLGYENGCTVVRERALNDTRDEQKTHTQKKIQNHQ
jgi:hypothetical protein